MSCSLLYLHKQQVASASKQLLIITAKLRPVFNVGSETVSFYSYPTFKHFMHLSNLLEREEESKQTKIAHQLVHFPIPAVV